MTEILPVILSGGSGTRLWPLSTHAKPKQFHALVGGMSMIAATAARAADLAQFAPPLVIGNAVHEGLLRDHLADHRPMATVLEPAVRNTAAAVAVAALVAAARMGEDTPLLILPSDHAIANTAAFEADALLAGKIAANGSIVTFGIRPDEPHTGYGYIRHGQPDATELRASRVDRFIEKPDADKAKAMLEQGGYSWNSGMFALTAKTALAEFAAHAPDILDGARKALAASRWDGDTLRLDLDTFAAIPSQAFDVAVMEKTDRAVVIEAAFDWTDVGSWPALHDVVARDNRGNTLRGTKVALSDDVANAYVRNETATPVFVSGVDNISVVVTENGIVVTSRDGAQNVRQAAALYDVKK